MRTARLKTSCEDLLSLIGKMDKTALFFHLLLLGIGVMFIYGAGLEIGGVLATKWYMQLVWITAGFSLYFFCALTDYHQLGHFSWFLYAFSLLLLLLVLVAGKTINGAKSWLMITSTFGIQPSEFSKPATLLFMSWAITHPAWHKSPVPPWALIILIAAPPLALVMLQPDVGTGLVFFPFSLALAFILGLKWRWILLGALAILLAVPLGYSVLKPHQKARIKVFIEPHSNALLVAIAPLVSEQQLARLRQRQEAFLAEDEYHTPGEPPRKSVKRDDWNARQSLLAVGSGGMTGKGFLKGTQHVLGYLPKNVAPSDFIFSVIAEETGFLGSAVLLLSFFALIVCGCRTAILASDRFGSCLALGVAIIFATHAFINIGMTVQALPIIGIPLPFVSYGGTFILACMILAGLSQSVHIHRDLQEDQNNL